MARARHAREPSRIQASRSSAGRAARPAYVFAVAALAAFLIGLAAARPPIEGFIAAAIIECEGPEAKEGAPDLRQFASPQVNVEPVAGAANRYVLSLAGRDPEEALRAVTQQTSALAAAWRAAWPAPDPSLLERAHARFEAAQTAAQRAQKELAAWETRHAEAEAAQRRAEREAAARKAEQEAARRAEAKTAQQAQDSAPQPEPIPNPRWSELAYTIERLKEDRLHLLRHRTPAHPEVVDLEAYLKEVERALAATPQFLPPPEPARDSAPSPGVHPATPPTGQPDLNPPSEPETTVLAPPDPEEGEALRNALAQAQAELTAAKGALQQAQAPFRGPRPDVYVVQTAQIVGVAGGTPGMSGVAFLASLAATVGFVLARLAGRSASPDVFSSTDQVAQTLQLPVIAALTTGDGPAAAAPSFWRGRLVRASLCAAEATIVAVAVIVVYAAIRDPLVLRVASESALQALGLAFDAVWPR